MRRCRWIGWAAAAAAGGTEAILDHCGLWLIRRSLHACMRSIGRAIANRQPARYGWPNRRTENWFGWRTDEVEKTSPRFSLKKQNMIRDSSSVSTFVSLSPFGFVGSSEPSRRLVCGDRSRWKGSNGSWIVAHHFGDAEEKLVPRKVNDSARPSGILLSASQEQGPNPSFR